MTVALTGAGSLGVRLGHLAEIHNCCLALVGGSLTVDGRATTVSSTVTSQLATVMADYAAGTALYATVDGLQTQYAAFQQIPGGFLVVLRALAQATLVKMCDDDSRLPSRDVGSALALLVSQMVSASASVKANVPALGAQTAVGSPTGTPVVVGSVKRGDGKYSGVEYALAETVTFTCGRDAQSGGATANQESFSVRGQNAQGNTLAYDWPKGSGASQTMTVVDAAANNGNGNVLVNSGFEVFSTSNIADNWTLLVGTAGTDFGKEATNYYADGGAGAAKFFADTGINTSITQTFGTAASTTPGAGGTAYNIAAFPETPFAVNVFARRAGVTTAGVITVDLVDGTNTVISDSNGTANSFAIAFGSLTTSYAAFSGVFRLPAAVPSSVKLRIRASTAVTGAAILVDHVAMTRMVRLYDYGPFFSIFSSATKPLLNDAWTMALTVSAAGALQRLFQKWFSVQSFGLQLPSKADGSETVADTLIA